MNCEICGAEISGGSAFTCTYCGGTFCPEHRLPFNHACRNIEQWRKSGAQGKKVSKQVKQRKVPIPVSADNKILIAGAVAAILLVIALIVYFKP